jgi:peptidyl-prolyl cis-trans isomerase C
MWEPVPDGWAGWVRVKIGFRFTGLKHTYIRKDRIEMRIGREHQCLRTPKPAVLGLILATLLTVTGWAQDSAQPPAATKPAAQGQPAAGSPPATATQPPAPGQPEVLKVPADKVVMRVGKMEVTAGEMDAVLRSLPIAFQRAVSTQGMKVVGDQYSVLLALSQKAANEGLDKTPEFKQKLELQRIQWLAQDEYQRLASEATVSPEEISKYYQQNQPEFEQVEIRQVSVRKKSAAANASNAPGLPEPEAKARAEEIRQALVSGQDAAKVADQYKMTNIVFFDPNPHPVRRGQLPGEMDKVAWALKDGEVSDIQNNPMNFYFVQVVKHDQQELKEVSGEIESKIKQQAFEKRLDALKQQADIWLDPQYFAPAKPPAPQPQAAAPAANPEAPSSKPQ